MSEPIPEGGGGNPPGGGGGSFLTRKFAGIPAWVILAAVALLAYMYFRSKNKSAGGSGQNANRPRNVYVRSWTEIVRNYFRGGGGEGRDHDHEHEHDHDDDGERRVDSRITGTTNTHQQQRVWHPQPRPPVKKPLRKNSQTVMIGRTTGETTAGRAEWNTTLWGISQHTGVPISTLMRLNPQIQNPALIYPGEKIRISEGEG